ncbi:MAG: transposase [Proteobacteria bacterium]|nr:transposase [Pseudomonadota bacterium]
MAIYRRNRVHGGTFFFTVTLRNRSSCLLVDHVALLREAFTHTRRTRPFAIDAIVILPEHIHAIWTLPDDDLDYSGRWRSIKSLFVRSLKTAGAQVTSNPAREHDVWQRRFWEHTIRDANDMQRHVDYIHFNPVKHGYVSTPVEWRYSSIHRYVRDGLLPVDWGASRKNDFSGNFGER